MAGKINNNKTKKKFKLGQPKQKTKKTKFNF